MTTPEDEYEEHKRQHREELKAKRDSLSEEEKTRRIQLSEARKARIEAESPEEKEAKRIKAANLFGESFGKGPPLRFGLTQEIVVVPLDLREIMIDVHRRIRDGDESATNPSSDFLQYERAYGGLDKTGDRYSFVYFGGEGHSIRWEFTLRPEEIERLADGRIDQLNVQRFERISVP